MTVQFNTDNHVSGNEEHIKPLVESIEHGLRHFSSHITRVEAHLRDDNADKNTPGDKRCMLEARLEGRQPVAVTYYADTHDEAVEGAVEKMKALLNTTIGKMKEHQ